MEYGNYNKRNINYNLENKQYKILNFISRKRKVENKTYNEKSSIRTER